MVGLRRPKNRTTSQRRRSQPLVTPAQRIPQGTETALVSAKRPKTDKAVAGGRATGDQGSGTSTLQNISCTVVPTLLSSTSGNLDGEDVVQSEARVKMADPTPTEEAEVSTAHASSTRDAPSTDNAGTELTIVADVRAQADSVYGQRNENRQEDAQAVGDTNQEPRSLSEDEEDRRFAEMVDWKRECCERIAAAELNSALLRQEKETLRNRRRELEDRRRELEDRRRELEDRRRELEDRLREVDELLAGEDWNIEK